MTTLEALARLTAYWPSIGGDDAAAEMRLQYWKRALNAVSDQTRAEAVEQLIMGWKGDWAPKITDWQDACNQLVRRRELAQPERYAIEETHVPADRVQAIIAEMRAKLDAAPKYRGWKR